MSGRVRCTNVQGQAPHMGANGTNMAYLIVFTLTGRREEFPARGDPTEESRKRAATKERVRGRGERRHP